MFSHLLKKSLMKNFNFCAMLTIFVGRTPSQIFDMALNTPLINIEHKMNSVADKTQFLCIFLPWSMKMILHILGSSIYYVHKMFRKTDISYPLIRTRTCAYQVLRQFSFSENFASVLNGWPPYTKMNFYIFVYVNLFVRSVIWNPASRCLHYKRKI